MTTKQSSSIQSIHELDQNLKGKKITSGWLGVYKGDMEEELG
jgi:hypothetical protein